MLHLCSDCPGKTNLNKFLTEHFINNESDLADNIFYKQWISTDRTTLVNHYSTVEEFIAKIVDDVYEVCPHHFIAKAQANHLKMAKENLSENELIILLDFAEMLCKMLCKDFIGKIRKQHYTHLLHILDLPIGT